jgi:hypothetical protein
VGFRAEGGAADPPPRSIETIPVELVTRD